MLHFRETVIVRIRSIIHVAQLDADGIAAFVELGAKTLTVHNRSRLLERAHVIGAVARKLRVGEFHAAYRELPLTGQNTPRVVDKTFYVFLGTDLRSDAHHFNTIDAISFLSRVVAFIVGQSPELGRIKRSVDKCRAALAFARRARLSAGSPG